MSKSDTPNGDHPTGEAVQVPRQLPDLTGLTDAERVVYVSCDLEGLTPSELADFEKWDASTIRTLLSRARDKMDEK